MSRRRVARHGKAGQGRGTTKQQDARLDVLEAVLRKNGIDVPTQRTVQAEITAAL